MKICIVNKKYPAHNGRILAEYNYKKGHEVTIINTNNNNYNTIENGIKIINIIDDEKLLSDTLKELQENGEIDLIHTYSNESDINTFLKYRKIPMVVTLLEDNIDKKIVSKADTIISSNKYTCSEYKSEIIPNLSDTDVYKCKREKNKNILYVGDLNQESYIIDLAYNIDKIIAEVGNVKFQFVGCDTNKNDMEISTKDYIYNMISYENKSNIEFIENANDEELNNLYNNATILFNPSFEILSNSSICGIPYLGTEKVREFNPDYDYIFNKENLYEKLIELYSNKEMQKIIATNLTNKKIDNDKIISMYEKVYKKAIDNYNEVIITSLFTEHINDEIISFKKIDSGYSNFVYMVNTKLNKYIVKTYKSDINIDMIKDLIKICLKNNIKIINPIDNMFYKINNNIICIYEYIEGKQLKKLTNCQIEKIIDFIKLDKPSTNKKVTNLNDKVDFYYNSLREMNTKKIHRTYIDELLKKYMKLKNYNIFNEKQLVHGDLNPSNIIWDENNDFVLLDLDETIEFTKLYDLIVLAISYSKNGSEIDSKLARRILKSIDTYSKVDIINVWNFYLLKVILEKIYLYEINKIDLRDEFELLDNWEDYYKILDSCIIEDILNK